MTIKELAEICGVSISTVSKVLNNKDKNISDETRDKILAAAKKYNYSPYSKVIQNNSGKTFTLAALFHDENTLHKLLDGIIEQSQNESYTLIVLDSKNDELLEKKHLESLYTANVDGILWSPVNIESYKRPKLFEHSSCHIMVLPRKDSNLWDLQTQALGFALTAKLLKAEHKNIACIADGNNINTQNFITGYQAALYERRIIASEKNIFYGLNTQTLSRILANHVTAVVCESEFHAVKLQSYLAKLNLRVPRNLSIVTLFNSERTQNCAENLSGIIKPYTEFAKFVTSALIKSCEEKTRSNFSTAPDYTLPIKFTEGSSVYEPQHDQEKNIMVVGSFHIDYTFYVDKIPQADKTSHITHSIVSLGGKGANQAIALHLLGKPAYIIGRVGQDSDLELVLDTLRKYDIPTDGIEIKNNYQTGKAYIYVDGQGGSTIAVSDGANSCLSPESIDEYEDLFKRSELCLISTGIPMETVLAAAKKAKEYDAAVILKPTAVKELPEELYHLVDLLIPNQKEANELTGSNLSYQEQAEILKQRGASEVIITLGADGCYLHNERSRKHFPAANFTPVDTTGGADAFISALAYGLSEGYSIEKSIQTAGLAAGYCVSKPGVISSLIDRETLLKLSSER